MSTWPTPIFEKRCWPHTPDFRITVLDSCASGSFTRAKGGAAVAPFLVDQSAEVKGDAVLTSSSATEASQESDRVGGSFFTHHLLSGLRGAADVSRDGKVTLNEAYQFAFDETLARTERTRAGAQHPAFDIAVAGTGEVVVTDLRGTEALLAIPEAAAGRLFVRDAQGRLAVELRKNAGSPVQLGLEPGTYQVTVVEGERVLGGTVALTAGAPTVLDPAGLRLLPAEANPLRGENQLEGAPHLRLWHAELRAYVGSDLSDEPVPSSAFSLPTLGVSYFIRPLRDDGETPFELLRFFQRPDEFALSFAPLSLGSANVAFDPNLSLGGAVYPWHSFGLMANVGFSKGVQPGELGVQFGVGASFFPVDNLRLSARYGGTRNQTLIFPGVGAPDGQGVVESSDALDLEAQWVLGRKWSLSLAYDAQWLGQTRTDTNTNLTIHVPVHQISFAGSYSFNRWLSCGLNLSTLLMPVYSKSESEPAFVYDGHGYLLQALPHVRWFINDFLALTFAAGVDVTTLRTVDPSRRQTFLGGAASLAFTARL